MPPRRLTTLYIKALTATWILVIVPLTMGAYSCTAFQRRSEDSGSSRGPTYRIRPVAMKPKAIQSLQGASSDHSDRWRSSVTTHHRTGNAGLTPVLRDGIKETASVTPQRDGELVRLAEGASKLCGVPRNLFFALIARESSWKVDAVSSSGALGLAQIKPSTLKHVSPTLDPSRPFDRLVGAACYLRMQFDATGDWQRALHRYNAGPSGEVTDQVRSYAKGIMEASNE